MNRTACACVCDTNKDIFCDCLRCVFCTLIIISDSVDSENDSVCIQLAKPTRERRVLVIEKFRAEFSSLIIERIVSNVK